MTLSDRIAALTGPDREVDAEIELILRGEGWRIQTDCAPFPDEVRPGRIQEIGGCGWVQSKPYTGSLDAAVSIFPKDTSSWAIDSAIEDAMQSAAICHDFADAFFKRLIILIPFIPLTHV